MYRRNPAPVLTDRHDLAPCAANSLHRVTISVNDVIGGTGTLEVCEGAPTRSCLLHFGEDPAAYVHLFVILLHSTFYKHMFENKMASDRTQTDTPPNNTQLKKK